MRPHCIRVTSIFAEVDFRSSSSIPKKASQDQVPYTETEPIEEEAGEDIRKDEAAIKCDSSETGMPEDGPEESPTEPIFALHDSDSCIGHSVAKSEEHENAENTPAANW